MHFRKLLNIVLLLFYCICYDVTNNPLIGCFRAQTFMAFYIIQLLAMIWIALFRLDVHTIPSCYGNSLNQEYLKF